ncbi:MAG: hypothetical protein K1060chlam2_01050 [Chlamydiae bacterium]|nr:hypothetical protein [Chlamydiota bacterium]
MVAKKRKKKVTKKRLKRARGGVPEVTVEPGRGGSITIINLPRLIGTITIDIPGLEAEPPAPTPL